MLKKKKELMARLQYLSKEAFRNRGKKTGKVDKWINGDEIIKLALWRLITYQNVRKVY